MPQSASLSTQRKGASCNNTPCLGFITPLRNGNAHQKLGKLISAKDRIAAYLGKCRAKTNKLHKIAPRTGDSCQSFYLNWLPLYHCQETLNPETSCGDVKFACLYSSLALAWRTASCKAPNTNKIQTQNRSVKGFYPDATSLCHRGLVKNINALKLAGKMLICLMFFVQPMTASESNNCPHLPCPGSS